MAQTLTTLCMAQINLKKVYFGHFEKFCLKGSKSMK